MTPHVTQFLFVLGAMAAGVLLGLALVVVGEWWKGRRR